VARPKPCLVSLKGGRTYLWCRCGRSANQPFCDGSHRGTGLEPKPFVVRSDEEVLLCGCKHSADPPFCDGTHTNLPGGSPLDDPASPGNRSIPWVTERDGPRIRLNGASYVVSPPLAETAKRGALSYRYLVSDELGATYQTQILLQVSGGASPLMSLGDREVILFVMAGRGTINISGRPFDVKATDGLYVRPSEALQLLPARSQTLEVFALSCPPGRLEWPESMPDTFDARYTRCVYLASMRRSAGRRGRATFSSSWTSASVRRSSRSSSATYLSRRPRPTGISTRKRSSCSQVRAACGPRIARRGFKPAM
jgi:CDGSH-type Zn-finger protein/mannose-6-phosphate isomerase-like protein (cupin superfamily)